jgi:hypothetical protein
MTGPWTGGMLKRMVGNTPLLRMANAGKYPDSQILAALTHWIVRSTVLVC